MEIITKSPKETYDLGTQIGNSLKGGEVLTLQGDLGAGKTTFVQGLAHALGIEKTVPSPTFVIMRRYKGDSFTLFHTDLYRLEGNVDQEVENLGIFDLWNDSQNIFVIEWAEKLTTQPKNVISISIEILEGDTRKFIINKNENIH